MLFLYISDGYLLGMSLWLVGLAGGLVGCLKWRQRRRRAGLKVGAIPVVLSAWMFAAALTAVELYFALCYDQTDSFNMTNISKRWFERHTHVNSRNFRDVRLMGPRGEPVLDARGRPRVKEFPFKSLLGQPRLIFVGDSFTYGNGVEEPDRFSDRVAAALQHAHRGRWDVHNLGVSGMGTPEVVLTLRRMLEEGDQIDVAVYSVCLNDLEYLGPRDKVDAVYETIKARVPRFFLFRDTYFFNMLYFRALQFTLPEVRGYFDFLRNHYDGKAWDEMQAKFDELRELCAANKVDLRIAVFPFLHNLGPDYPFRDAHRKIVAYFQSHGIRVLDLEPVLSPHATEGLTANRFDAHPNARAHQLAADAMEAELLEDLFR